MTLPIPRTVLWRKSGQTCSDHRLIAVASLFGSNVTHSSLYRAALSHRLKGKLFPLSRRCARDARTGDWGDRPDRLGCGRPASRRRGMRFAGSPGIRRGRAALSRKRNGCRSTSPPRQGPRTGWPASPASMRSSIAPGSCRIRRSTRRAACMPTASARCSRPANAPASAGRPPVGDRRRPRDADRVFAHQARGRRGADAARSRLGDPAPVGRARAGGLWRQRAVPGSRGAADPAGDARYRTAPNRAARRCCRNRSVFPRAGRPVACRARPRRTRAPVDSPKSFAATGPGWAGANRASSACRRWLGALLYRLGDFAGLARLAPAAAQHGSARDPRAARSAIRAAGPK